MYFPGQVIHSFDVGGPVAIKDVWSVEDYPQRHTHYIIQSKPGPKEEYKIFTPRSVAEATCLLAVGIISPCPAAILTHCWRCQNWHDNCRSFGCLEGEGN